MESSQVSQQPFEPNAVICGNTLNVFRIRECVEPIELAVQWRIKDQP